MIAIEGPVAWLRHTPAEGLSGRDPREALQEVAAELMQRAERAPADAAAMLRAHAMMATDPVLWQRLEAFLQAGLTPDRALWAAGSSFGLENPELRDVIRRVTGPRTELPRPGHPYVLVAEDLTAIDMIDIEPTQVRGIIAIDGGPTSHAAILARSMGIPSIWGYPEARDLADGQWITIRGSDQVDVMPAVQRVPLLANVASAADVTAAVAAGAEGIGLLRTEFLPDFDYSRLVEPFAGKPVIIRAMDVGGRDENPLGVRGLRYLRSHAELLERQLAAIARVGGASVMAPMVSTAEEMRWFRDRCEAHGIRDVGAMVEVPAAALCIDEILAESDFVSIGTNDLVQFTFAADRQLGALASYQDATHPAVLKLIRMVAQAGLAAGKPVGVCGEAAADPHTAGVLIGLGVTSLSMTPAAIARVRMALAP